MFGPKDEDRQESGPVAGMDPRGCDCSYVIEDGRKVCEACGLTVRERRQIKSRLDEIDRKRRLEDGGPDRENRGGFDRAG